MSAFKWISSTGTATDWSTGAAWKDIALGTTGAVPGNTGGTDDTVVFDGEGTDAVIFNAGSYDAIHKCTFSPSYAGLVGVAGVPFSVPVTGPSTNGELVYAGSGAAAYFGASSITAMTCRHSGHGVNACQINGVGSPTITDLNCLRGKVTVSGGITVSNLYTGWLSSPQNDVNLTIDSGVTVSVKAYLNGGRVLLNTVSGGSGPASGLPDTDVRNSVLTVSNGNISNLVMNGGQVIYNAEDDGTDPNITSAFLLAGTLNMSQDGRAKSIATLRHWQGATFLADNGGKNITIDTAYYMYGNAQLVSGAQQFTVIPL